MPPVHRRDDREPANCNDGRVALKVLKDLDRYGALTAGTRKQLLAWCYTEETVYQRGVPLAREICLAVYERIPPKECAPP
jgi:hypothetical protein